MNSIDAVNRQVKKTIELRAAELQRIRALQSDLETGSLPQDKALRRHARHWLTLFRASPELRCTIPVVEVWIPYVFAPLPHLFLVRAEEDFVRIRDFPAVGTDGSSVGEPAYSPTARTDWCLKSTALSDPINALTSSGHVLFEARRTEAQAEASRVFGAHDDQAETPFSYADLCRHYRLEPRT